MSDSGTLGFEPVLRSRVAQEAAQDSIEELQKKLATMYKKKKLAQHEQLVAQRQEHEAQTKPQQE